MRMPQGSYFGALRGGGRAASEDRAAARRGQRVGGEGEDEQDRRAECDAPCRSTAAGKRAQGPVHCKVIAEERSAPATDRSRNRVALSARATIFVSSNMVGHYSSSRRSKLDRTARLYINGAARSGLV